MSLLTALLSGLVFGLGLVLSGMANPSKVIGFLDLFGAWDPSLMLVMASAVGVSALAVAMARRRRLTPWNKPIVLPTASDIDPGLVLGSLLFGVGWGMAGFCPGPGLVALGMAEPKAAAFVAAMLVGMGVYEWLPRGANRGQAATTMSLSGPDKPCEP